MCIFNHEVKKVSGTKIFVGPIKGGERQFTVYQNFVDDEKKGSESKQQNAMILPFPQGPVDLIDLTEYKDFFKHCSRCFDPPTQNSRSKSFGLEQRTYSLKVHVVGSYNVSIAETLEDVARANPEVFTLSSNVSELLGRHYATGYSFLICCFQESGEKHPLGYVHKRQKQEDESQALFVPTMHLHGDHEVSLVHDWDHEIYSVNTNNKEEVGGLVKIIPGYEWMERELKFALPESVQLGRIDSFRQLSMKGSYKNQDLIFNSGFIKQQEGKKTNVKEDETKTNEVENKAEVVNEEVKIEQ
eukprot:TRINITY_DN3489_c0_g1_i1.p1 TRINITY_DN3489_c0_g1~~TRINITY_DN3489_c0_g1_i1.p1  ORF type:complete len:300 (-),score=66.85 TRINITY_DN3489_c0_g1_i1:64-963(-)